MIWKGNNPIIGLSLRYNRIDNLLFTLFHELGHLFIHIKSDWGYNTFVDTWEDKTLLQTEVEAQADAYAKDKLIPKQVWQEFVETTREFTDRTITLFACNVGVLPAVVRGRLCFEKRIPYRSKTLINYQIR
jgi:HTH-type transcriptional regulator/antitoxin HigA